MMKEKYIVKKLEGKEPLIIKNIPGSKSITNRALLLAALGRGKCTLEGVLFSDDSRVFLKALQGLGVSLEIMEEEKRVIVCGEGSVPNRDAEVYVGSAGTAARFLTVMLAVLGGHYVMTSSDQMKKRPMQELLEALRSLGVSVSCLEEEGHFPFVMDSKGISGGEIAIDTTNSSQFASALMLSACAIKGTFRIRLTGSRTNGSYIKITERMLTQFGISYEREGDVITFLPQEFSGLDSYVIEPDASAAGYFWALGAVLGRKVTVANLHLDSMQGDVRLVSVLRDMGCLVEDEAEGLSVTGPAEGVLRAVSVNMKDFSDQTMTVAAIAPFADGEVHLMDISHIRLQESDRMQAIQNELGRMGIRCVTDESGEGLVITPGTVQAAEIQTYEDHRMAMAFTIPGLRTGNLQILDPMCCKKTFENFFDVIDSLY
ncbi:MAG: 3-phosphoshikimate 1-carboxyvinyltransferase [Lachnospiraceae bacterium]|nr:3-phosphoshikimate 1-carboxyvinyltransferase [Lachnospiraceae bacterium]